MPAPISVQLYSVRNLAAKDFAGTVKQIADIGFTGVETAGFPGTDAKGAAKIFADLGLLVSSGHFPMPVGDKLNEVVDQAKTIGAKFVISGLGPDDFKSEYLIKRSADRFNEAGANAKAAGLKFGIHNHWWEFLPVGSSGQRAYEILLQHLCCDVYFQVDTYWVKTGGACPSNVLKQLGKRAPLLHIKDGPAKQGVPMTAVGQGTMKWYPVISASEGNAEWLIVELDDCATDMMTAVKESYQFLTGQGFARGNK